MKTWISYSIPEWDETLNGQKFNVVFDATLIQLQKKALKIQACINIVYFTI